MDSKGVSGTTFFIFVASYVIIILVTFIVVAVAVSEREDAKIKEAGGSRNLGFWERLLGAFDDENVDDLINNNNPDQNNDGLVDSSSLLDPNGDLDGDGTKNLEDIDLDGDGIFNKDEVSFECGDVNHDGVINEDDVEKIVDYVFEGLEIPADVNVDLNADEFPDVIDVTLLIDYVYRQGDQPTCTKPENRPPVIDSFTGPSFFKVSEGVPPLLTKNNNSWIITANDPEGGILKYGINWGDGKVSNYEGGNSGLPLSIWHSYDYGGKYTIQVKVTDSGGLYAVNSKIVELPYTSSNLVCDFSSNNSFGVQKGGLLIARDEQGVLVGVSNKINIDGSFFIHAVGDDPLTQDVDEGARLGSPIKFYTETNECFLTSGSNIWVPGGNKIITLSCTGAKSFNDLGVFACGDVNQDGSIDKDDVSKITSYIFEGEKIPFDVNVDLNADGVPDVLDITLLTNHVYRNGAAPTCVTLSNAKSYTANPTTCGNINQDSSIDKLDVEMLSDYVFSGGEVPRGSNADMNGDGVADVIDVVILTNYVYRSGTAPTCANLGAGA